MIKNKLNKIIDKKLLKIGFHKVKDDEHGVYYERLVPSYNYTLCLDIMNKKSKNHIISSYQKDINFDGFNNSVGLTGYETLLILCKMILSGFYSK